MDVFLPSSAGSHLERVFWNKVLNSGYIGGSQYSKFFVCDLANIHFRPASWVESHFMGFVLENTVFMASLNSASIKSNTYTVFPQFEEFKMCW